MERRGLEGDELLLSSLPFPESLVMMSLRLLLLSDSRFLRALPSPRERQL